MNSLYKYVYGQEKKGLDNIADDQLIKAINDLRSVGIDINFPKIVVVGTQSSGKSSLLNAIINKPILPIGEKMVTRTPMDIRVIASHEEKIEINDKQIASYEDISKEIETITRSIAGDGKGISNIPIITKIHNRGLSNLSFIDLPGYTLIARTDEGQSSNMKEQICDVAAEYLKQDNTIIVVVMAGRSDLEADVGLAMVKEYDLMGERTLGVITKVDLMNNPSDIMEYLEGNISKDLKLYYGYHAIVNRNGIDDQQFFKQHGFRTSFGVHALTTKIREILVNKIRKSLPDIRQRLGDLETKNEQRLMVIGKEPPLNINDKKIFIGTQYAEMRDKINRALNEEGFHINTGIQLKEVFVAFRSRICAVEHPFNIQKAIANCEGNHMNYSVSPIKILEYCIKNDGIEHIYKQHVDDLIERIRAILMNLVEIVLDDLQRFPHLYDFLRKLIGNKIEELAHSVHMTITKIIRSQINYVWTNDKNFLDELKENGNDFKKIIGMYLCIINETISDVVPKLIMSEMIIELCKHRNQIEDNCGDVNKLMEEVPAIDKERKECMIIKQTIGDVKKLLI